MKVRDLEQQAKREIQRDQEDAAKRAIKDLLLDIDVKRDEIANLQEDLMELLDEYAELLDRDVDEFSSGFDVEDDDDTLDSPESEVDDWDLTRTVVTSPDNWPRST